MYVVEICINHASGSTYWLAYQSRQRLYLITLSTCIVPNTFPFISDMVRDHVRRQRTDRTHLSSDIISLVPSIYKLLLAS